MENKNLNLVSNYFTISFFIIVFVASFIFASFLFSDNTALKSRNIFSLKKELKIYNKDNPEGVGGYYIPEQRATPVSYLTYVIKSGDSLHGISKKLGVDVVTILNFNDINIPSRIINGKKIIIPNQDGMVVDIGGKNSIKKIADKYKVEVDDILSINSIENGDNVDSVFVPGLHTDPITRSLLLGEFFVKPTRGVISSYFGYRRDPWTKIKSFHTGVDIRNSLGTKIYSSGFGQVINVAYNSWPLGNMIAIKHPAGY
ncbi:MAG TPA: M23 family metallopeptidase, partial [Spirochaetota bacterium]|nr:M23 family metallopeptidase [Spirochaetota bacterium]